VFAQPDDEIPVKGAKVTITDSTGQKKSAKTNCAGNFYIEEADFTPVYPVRVEIECTTPAGFSGVTETYRNVMGTRVNRDGSCAGCHDNEPASQNGPGRVYCMDGRLNNPFSIDPDCVGGPKPGDAASAAVSSSSASSSSASSSSGGM
jgi:hypothetical protein